MKRRNFIKDSAITASTFSVFPNILSSVSDMSSVRLGFIGVGARGMETLELALRRKDIVVTAICDIDTIHAEKAKNWWKKIKETDLYFYLRSL